MALLNSTTNTTAVSVSQGEIIRSSILRNLPQYVSAYWLDATSLWVLTIIGLIGNSLSLVTILRLTPFTTSYLYLLFLAVMDSSSLVIKLTLQQVSEKNIGIGDAGCRSLLFLGNTSVMVANWLVVAMTAERLIAIWYPMKVATISTKTKTVLVFISLVIVFMGINVAYLFAYEETWNSISSYGCLHIPEYSEFVFNVLHWLDAAYALLPCGLLLIFNTLILIGTWRSLKMQKKMNQNQGQLEEKRRQQNQITAMLVTVSVTFLLFTIPMSVFVLVTGTWNPTTNAGYAEKILVDKIIYFLSNCNHAVNFFLYFFSGRRFREMFLKTFCGLCMKCVKPRNGNPGVRLTNITSVTVK